MSSAFIQASSGFFGAIGLNPSLEALSIQFLVILFALATYSVVQRNSRLTRQHKAAMRSAKPYAGPGIP